MYSEVERIFSVNIYILTTIPTMNILPCYLHVYPTFYPSILSFIFDEFQRKLFSTKICIMT